MIAVAVYLCVHSPVEYYLVFSTGKQEPKQDMINLVTRHTVYRESD